MNLKVRNRPPKPLLLYDGNCRFCKRWARRMYRFTRGSISCRPFQCETQNYPEISLEEMARRVQFIEADGTVYSGAAAAYKIISYRRGLGFLLTLYSRSQFLRKISESMYDYVSHHRHHL